MQTIRTAATWLIAALSILAFTSCSQSRGLAEKLAALPTPLPGAPWQEFAGEHISFVYPPGWIVALDDNLVAAVSGTDLLFRAEIMLGLSPAAELFGQQPDDTALATWISEAQVSLTESLQRRGAKRVSTSTMDLPVIGDRPVFASVAIVAEAEVGARPVTRMEVVVIPIVWCKTNAPCSLTITKKLGFTNPPGQIDDKDWAMIDRIVDSLEVTP